MSAFASARSTLADRVAATRHQRFVGRHAEISRFREALALPEPPFAVLFLHGPGGIGKTTLLGEYRRIAELESRPVVAIDGRACEPSPPGVLAAIGRELGISDPAACLPALAARDNLVLFIDTYEMLRPLDGWLRNDLLPRLPASAVTVIAGRLPPDLAWRASAGWGDLVAVEPLRNLAPAESRDYLSRRGIPPAAHASVIEFTHGHPLALSLIGDVAVRTRASFTPEDAPDVVAALIDHFIEHEPSPRHRQALETCATARVTTEALLARAFGEEQAHELFSWLCGLSFIEHDRDGVFPHDLARDALVANLRWRHPARFVETHTMVHDYVVEQVRSTRGREQFQWLYSLMFLHRNNPTWRSFAPMDQHGQEYLDAPTPDDAVQFIDLVQRHEGPRSAEIADRWLRTQPEQLRVLRDVHGEMNGAILGIELGALRRDDVAFDPVAVAIFDMIERHGPLRPGDEAMCARFAMGRDQYRTPKLRLSFSILGSSMIYTRPRLAWMCTPVVDPPFWEKMFQYVHINPYPDADVDVDGRTWHMYAHDWRQEPIEELDPILTQHEMSVSPVLDRVPEAAPALMVLSEAEFRQAVRQALRDFHRAGELAANPLGHSRLVQSRAGGDAVAALRELLLDAAATLTTGSRLRRLHDALRLTWLEPAGTQEAVAEALGVPFSTYRRHLAAAADHVAGELWRQELALGGFRAG